MLAATLDVALTPHDFKAHAALGIDAELLERAKVRRVTDAEARDLLGLRHHHGSLSEKPRGAGLVVLADQRPQDVRPIDQAAVPTRALVGVPHVGLL